MEKVLAAQDGVGRTRAELRSEEATRLAGLAAATEEEKAASHGLTITQIVAWPRPAGRRKPMAGPRAVRHPERMPLLPVSPDDPAQVAALVGIHNAAQRVDDPE